ncbi:MAG: UDP-3-O-(3-hydroxymyristoyl)glucosamine N-acyltransferase [Cyanobacteria bacterium P01_A01_bin.3]
MLISEIARRLDCAWNGEDAEISGVAGLAEAAQGQLTFVSDPKYLPLLDGTQASAVILDRKTPVPNGVTCLQADNPRLAFAKALEWFYAPYQEATGVHPTAVVAEGVQLGAGVAIGPNAVVMSGVKLGDRTQVHANVTVYPNVNVGSDCVLLANCVLHERTQVGDRCIIHSGTSVGDDGFGYVPQADGQWYRMLQSGHVVLEDGVELGANVAIDRPAVGVTRIGAGTKIDNLVQLGHGVDIGANTLLCSQVGIAGGTKLGRNVLLAGQVGVVDHIELGNRVMAAAQTGISADVPDNTVVGGYPHQTARDWKRTVAVQRKLPDLASEVRRLKKRLAEIEDKLI